MENAKSVSSDAQEKGLLYKIELFFSKYKLPLLIICAIALLLLPMLNLTTYVMRIIIMIGVYTILGLGLNILTGYVGQLSLGHAGFYAIGAYTAAILMKSYGTGFFVTALCGAALSALCGLLLGLPTLRLKGTYLAIVTLGFGEIVRMILMNWDPVTNGTLGISQIPNHTVFGIKLSLVNNGLYYLMLFLVFIVAISCSLIIRSKIGRNFRSIKEDEIASAMMGIPVTRYKILAFVISAFITGAAGAFYAGLAGYIEPNTFTFDVSALIISVVIIGGMGTLRGMFLGAAVLIIFPEISRQLMDYRFVVYGAALVLMILFRPQGILGWRSHLPYKMPKQVSGKKKEGA